ncbi:hypothetical protein CYMTET_23304 [Cymbomonas tetramitiformis]|uniref:Uncharacterized protein n=1 Tax=Cymbomonas tetramitiformis TaxID=36881 RepID=A0AAE0FY67_9CHLO|nr:hypothetical protein CYMTET_23304 [Cymbomonas tetramitiformis]
MLAGAQRRAVGWRTTRTRTARLAAADLVIDVDGAPALLCVDGSATGVDLSAYGLFAVGGAQAQDGADDGLLVTLYDELGGGASASC